MSTSPRLLGSIPRFWLSDSRAIARMLLGGRNTDRTGSNSRNTSRVREAGHLDQASMLTKLTVLGPMTPKRRRVSAMTTSGLGYVYLEETE